jgi:PAS domain S-box-containing protein
MDVRRCPFRRPVTGRLCQGRATALAVGLLLVVAAFPAAPALAGAGQRLTALSPQEQAWLAEHPVVLLAPDADFPPIEFFDEQGQYRGIAADYAALVEQRLESRLPAYVAFVLGAFLLLSVITLAWNRSLKSQARQKVADLQIELEQRRRAEQALEEARLELERRVGERTSELEKSNRLLVEEIGERKRVQHDLDRFKSTLDRTLDCVFMFDPQTLKFFYVNAGAVAQVGYSSDELLNMTPLDITPDLSADEFRRLIQPLLDGDKHALTFETMHRNKDGRRVPVEIFLRFIAPADEYPRFVAIVRDITERKRIDAELSWNNRQIDLINRAQTAFIANTDHREAFELLLAGVLDLADSAYGFIGEVLYRGDDGAPYLRTHAITNIAWDEATRAFFEENAPRRLEFYNLDTLFGAAVRTGRPVIANDPANDERRGGLPPGHPSLDSFLGLPLFAGDRLVGMAGIANRLDGYDQALVESLAPYMNTCATLIEEYRSRQLRQHAEEQVKQSEERLRAVVSNVLESIITIDTSGIVESVNPATEKIFGYTAAEIVGQNVRMLMPEPHRGAHDQYLHNYLSAQGAKIIGSGREVPGRRKGGSTVPLELGSPS